MKKYLSLKSVYVMAAVVLMTSCVAKKKYTEAQNTISQLQTENARLRDSGTMMQQNLATLETERTSLQGRLDSTNTWVSGQQSRWNSFQAFYDEGMRTTEQVHQQLHTQLDELVGSENITTANGRITVTLTEKILFASGSSRLSSKGTEVLTQLAQVVKDNPNVEIDIASAPGFYDVAGTSGTTGDVTMNQNANQTVTDPATGDQKVKTGDAKLKTDEDGDVKYKDENTKIKADRDGDVKMKTEGTKTTARTTTKSNVNRSVNYSNTGTKSSANRSTARKSESKSRTYKSSPARKSATSASATWSLNMARSGAIAKKLVDEGVAKSRILVNNNTTASGANTNKDFQIIISPSSQKYYQSLGTGGMK